MKTMDDKKKIIEDIIYFLSEDSCEGLDPISSARFGLEKCAIVYAMISRGNEHDSKTEDEHALNIIVRYYREYWTKQYHSLLFELKAKGYYLEDISEED